MRFVVIQGVVLNIDAIDMIVPQDQQTTVFLRGGSERLLNLSAEELLAHLEQKDDQVVRVVSEAAKAAHKDSDDQPLPNTNKQEPATTDDTEHQQLALPA